jgi:hypothetical protein
MTCHHGCVRKKSQAPRQSLRKTHKVAVQTSSKRVGVAENDERQGHGLMTAFLEFAIPADRSAEGKPSLIAAITSRMSE